MLTGPGGGEESVEICLGKVRSFFFVVALLVFVEITVLTHLNVYIMVRLA